MGDDPVQNLTRVLTRIERRVGGLADRVGELGGRADTQDGQVGELGTLVRQLAADVTAYARTAQSQPPAPEAGDGEDPSLTPWLLDEDPAHAEAELTDLTDWVDRVYLWYPDANLPSCWAWHPAAVTELQWLRHCHRIVHVGEAASWRAVGEWHERLRPGVVRRLTATASCDLSRHSDGPRRTAPAFPVAAVARTWALAQRTPTPTPQQLDTAQTYDDNHDHTTDVR